ncbi:hypothetical protein HNQ88_003307 [Aureibacter tunicatorum]|uniref:Uncharacterized protein n=1 Tax=Aureibacter tunicatorum TaxID=866807 RepID=A0AAE3XQU6_9BACT|nr:hypothetical protein [Aureibacter tunicatorum]BDD05878.1 hypothetical protein AUTU_33610 [Aureibacter tunicatorum]
MRASLSKTQNKWDQNDPFIINNIVQFFVLIKYFLLYRNFLN